MGLDSQSAGKSAGHSGAMYVPSPQKPNPVYAEIFFFSMVVCMRRQGWAFHYEYVNDLSLMQPSGKTTKRAQVASKSNAEKSRGEMFKDFQFSLQGSFLFRCTKVTGASWFSEP
jgi:hypothetical protein